MSQIIVDKQLIEEFLTRGVANIYDNVDHLRKKLMSGEKLKVYQGYDPTGPYLHVGHAMGMRAMRLLQKMGHEVYFLVGDFTSRVGDPDKDVVRKLLTVEEIEANKKGWKQQATQLIDFEGENAVKFVSNYDWLSKLTLAEVIELMSHMTVQRMMERDMFERRYKKGDPIYVQEFIYPLMQGYDSVKMEIDIEVCGDDQTFNALVGRQLCKAYLGKEKFVRTNKMMDAPDGRTMSKTKGNGINLSDTAEDMYGKGMSYSDAHILMGLELLTSIPMIEIKQIEQEIKNGANPMQFKKLMAYQIVKEIKGDNEAKKAQENFELKFSKKSYAELENVQEFAVPADKIIIDFLVEQKFFTSKSEARRLITGGGLQVVVGEELVKIESDKLTFGELIPLSGTSFILKLGKKGGVIKIKVI